MLRINFPGFDRLNREALVRGFTRAGVYMTSKYRGYLNRDQRYVRYDGGTRYRGLSPSRPGDFPKKLSGQLQKSITWDLDKSKLILSVGSNLKGYPAYLQSGTRYMKPRPWLSLGFDLEKNNLAKLILGR